MRKWRYMTGFLLLAVCTAVLFVLGLALGSSRMTILELWKALAGENPEAAAYTIFWQIRMPRVIAALMLGGALSVSGFLLQCFFNNPIAGPFVLGISSGAKLAVALVMVACLQNGLVLHSGMMVLASFVGALASMGWILLLSGKVRSMSLLIISGVMTGYICSAITELVVAFADEANIVNLHNWSMGSFSGTDWADVRMMVLLLVPAVGLAFLLSKPLGAYQLGEAYAENLGVKLRQFRAAVILLSSVLAACVTAFAGPVSFVVWPYRIS